MESLLINRCQRGHEESVSRCQMGPVGFYWCQRGHEESVNRCQIGVEQVSGRS